MDSNYGTPISPMEEQPRQGNKTIWIIVIVVLVLCCCCSLFGSSAFWWLWNNGDALIEGTQLLRPLLI